MDSVQFLTVNQMLFSDKLLRPKYQHRSKVNYLKFSDDELHLGYKG